MHRLNVVDSLHHLSPCLVIRSKPIIKCLHMPSTHRVDCRTQRSNQASAYIHSSVNLASNLETCVPAITDDSLRVFPVRVEIEHFIIAIELLRQLWQLALVLPPPSSHLNRGFALSHKVRAWSQSPRYLRLHTLGSYRRSFHLDT